MTAGAFSASALENPMLKRYTFAITMALLLWSNTPQTAKADNPGTHGYAKAAYEYALWSYQENPSNQTVYMGYIYAAYTYYFGDDYAAHSFLYNYYAYLSIGSLPTTYIDTYDAYIYSYYHYMYGY
jgi:hypothetical protein